MTSQHQPTKLITFETKFSITRFARDRQFGIWYGRAAELEKNEGKRSKKGEREREGGEERQTWQHVDRCLPPLPSFPCRARSNSSISCLLPQSPAFQFLPNQSLPSSHLLLFPSSRRSHQQQKISALRPI